MGACRAGPQSQRKKQHTNRYPHNSFSSQGVVLSGGLSLRLCPCPDDNGCKIAVKILGRGVEWAAAANFVSNSGGKRMRNMVFSVLFACLLALPAAAQTGQQNSPNDPLSTWLRNI